MNDKIKCPNCGNQFDVEEALSGELEKKIQEKYQRLIDEQNKVLRDKETKLEQEREQFEKNKEKENELFIERLNKKVQEEKVKLELEAQEKASVEIQSLKQENEKKKEEVRMLREQEIALLKRENELKDAQEQYELRMQKQLLEKQKEIEEKGREKERQSHELKEKEYQKVIEDLRKSLEDSKRKAEQGSMQLQGEIQELAIEDYLNAEFPFDFIEEIKKGSMGGDCIQHVNTRDLKNCGTIYYESKRTKTFSDTWIEKLKRDMQQKNATLGVIVTESMPQGMDRLGMRNGIWVCDFNEFKGLSHALRESLILLKKNSIVQENKGDKMSLLYDYLTSQEFKMQIETIVDGFTAMREQLDAEKRAFQRQWKEREKQIDRVLQNTVEMYGSIRGIAGKAVPSIGRLEIDSSPETPELDF